MSVFNKIVHWSGIVIHAVLGVFHAAENKLEDITPELEKALETGASITSLIPGPIGAELTAALNLGIELVGAADKILHYGDEAFQKIVADVQAAVPPELGMAVLLIPQKVADDAKAFLQQIKAEADKVKDKANSITGPNGAPAANKEA